MANLTLAIDDDLLRAARIKAVQQGTSVNEICRDAIARYAAPADDADAFTRALRAIAARAAKAPRLPAQLPSRNDVMDEAMDERLPTLMARSAAPGR